MAQIKDAREAVDALREEHEQRRQSEMLELQRQRQIQMAAKLDIMRHKKHEMLEQQRLLVMQKMEEQRREMELRRQMQIQQQQQGSMVGVNVYSTPTGHVYGNVPVQQHYGPQQQTPQQQYDAYNLQQIAANLPQMQHQQQNQYVPGSLAGSQPLQFQQNPIPDQTQYVVNQQPHQAYHPAQPVQYYGQQPSNPASVSAQPQQQYGSMVYHQQQAHIPVGQPFQSSNASYNSMAANVPSGSIPSVQGRIFSLKIL